MCSRKPGKVVDSFALCGVIHKGISDLWHEGSCTDFEIVTGTESFRCHKVVLAAVSDYFKALFSSGMKETEQSKVTLDDVDPQTFKTILDLLYPKGQKNPLTKKSENGLLDLLKLAGRFQMKFLQDICIQYFQSTMTPANCVARWKQGEQLMCKELEDMGRKFIREHVEELVAEKLLVSLEADDFIDIISDDDMAVKTESIIWTAIKDWVNFNKDQRSEYMGELVKECCFAEIDRNQLIEDIAFEDIVRRSDNAAKVIRDVIRLERHPSIYGNVELKFRNCHERKQASLLFMSLDDDITQRPGVSNCVRGLIVLPDKTTHWISDMNKFKFKSGFAPRYNDASSDLACCIHGQRIYVLLADIRRKCEVLAYNIINNKWDSLQVLEMPLVGFTMTSTDDCLYVVGGKSQFQMNAQVWEYNIKNNTWSVDGEILAPVQYASSVALNEKLYLFGGELDGQIPADSVQVYDTVSKEATIFTSLPKPCGWSRAMLRDDTAIVVTREGDVLKINLCSGEVSTVVSLENFKRTNFGVLLKRNKLEILGGMVPTTPLVEVDESENKHDRGYTLGSLSVDIDDGTVTAIPDISLNESGLKKIVGCVSVVVKPDIFGRRIDFDD